LSASFYPPIFDDAALPEPLRRELVHELVDLPIWLSTEAAVERDPFAAKIS
jgi:hypothetical protein